MPEGSVVTLFDASGARVEVSFDNEGPELLKACILRYLDAGFLVRPPGLVEGESKETIGWVLRREHERDGETTTVIALYSANSQLTWKFLHKYLNDDTEIADFEKASGLKLQQLPLYNGDNYPERGSSGKNDRFIVQVPRPFDVVWKPNPKLLPAPNGTDTRTAIQKTAKLFVRWEGGAAAKGNGKEQDISQTEKEIAWWRNYLAGDPALDEVSMNVREMLKSKERGIVGEVWKRAIAEWCSTTGAEWDKEAKKFLPPSWDDPPQF